MMGSMWYTKWLFLGIHKASEAKVPMIYRHDVPRVIHVHVDLIHLGNKASILD